MPKGSLVEFMTCVMFPYVQYFMLCSSASLISERCGPMKFKTDDNRCKLCSSTAFCVVRELFQIFDYIDGKRFRIDSFLSAN